MPRINRIRIINFYYNNDTRQIADETFSFYDGENALLNLANGGGKSVLVQLMMQPIVPDYKLQKRSMASYFRHSTYPAYIMIEWVLDNPLLKDYLLTGIAIAPRVSSEEQMGNRMNYFTFASHYSEACNLDLSYVPFAKKEGERLTIMPFERAREAVRRLANDNREIFYFGRDDSAAYRELIARYGISQEEWRNIIGKMNNDEGGIDELFEKCSTSDGVLNEWIIKTIESAMIKTGDEDMQIHDLMDGLVSNTVRNEEYIRDQKNMKGYYEDHVELEAYLGKVYDTMVSFTESEEDLNRFLGLLMVETRNLGMELENLNADADELMQRLHDIDREEASESYYKAEEAYGMLSKEELEEKGKLESLNTSLQEREKERDIQKAARIYSRVNELQGDINALRLRLEERKQDTRIGDRMDSLRYTLKLAYGKELTKQTRLSKDLEQELALSQDALTDLNRKLSENRSQKEALGQQIAVLRSELKNFITEQDRLFRELRIGLTRNLLGSLDENEVTKVKDGFQRQLDAAKEDSVKLERRILEIKERLPEISNAIVGLSVRINGLEHEQQELTKKITAFEELESACRDILRQYEIHEDRLYQSAFLDSEMERRIDKLEQSRLANIQEQEQIKEMIGGIQSGNVYFPKALTSAMEELDIDYRTGESYLNSLEEEKRRKLLAINPLLPFAMLMKGSDLPKLSKVSFSELLLRQLVPVFTYDNISSVCEKEHSLTLVGEGFTFAAYYEEKLFKDEDRLHYLVNLREEMEQARARIGHLEEELNRVRDNWNTLRSFRYQEDYLPGLLKRAEGIEEELRSASEEKDNLGKEHLALEKEQTDKRVTLEHRKTEYREISERIKKFVDFLAKDEEYRRTLSQYSRAQKEYDRFTELIGKQEAEAAVMATSINESRDRLKDTARLLKELRSRAAGYEDAREAPLLEGSLDTLEQEYLNLVQSMDRELSDLELRLNEKLRELEERQKELLEFVLEESEYRDTTFEEARYTELLGSIKQLSKEVKDFDRKLHSLHDTVIKAEKDREYRLNRLKELGLTEPLPKDAILQDYGNRRKRIHLQQEEISEKRKILQKRLNLCSSKADSVRNIIEVHSASVLGMTLEEDINKQFEMLNGRYRKTKNGLDAAKRAYVDYYTEIKKKNEGKHPSISDILASMETLRVNEPSITSEKVHYYLEELRRKKESLIKYLEYYEQQLKTIEHTKKQVVDQCMSYGIQIYEGIQAISEKSRIRLSGKSRPVQMLKIGVPMEIDPNASERMKEYIEQALELSITDYKDSGEGSDSRQYRNRIRTLVSARQLLDVITGTNKITVSVYKIDLNERNSGLKRWEDAMAQNSGGEKFVVFFTMISTLISYTREALGKREGVDTSEESKVMIMDNPFARTSSEHLLKAVIDIAKTFRIQLICLSDLNQSSITNRFSLIYMLSVRRRMYSNNELLKIENVQMNKAGLEENEKLEHVSLYYQAYEQESLFDLMGDD